MRELDLKPAYQNMKRPVSVPGGISMLFMVLGVFVMLASLWLIGLGGMAAKLVLLGFWGLMIVPHLMQARLNGGDWAALFILCGLIGVVAIGAGGPDAKLRLIGNLLILPLGLICGGVIGRDCLRVMIPALVIYLPLASVFQLTHDGWRLNHPFLFLGLFGLCCVAGLAGRVSGVIGLISAVAVMLSQTRIAVFALLMVVVGRINLSRAWTWLLGLPIIIVAGFFVVNWLPRILMTHGSGRLAFWQMFWADWQAGSDSQKWLGFGAGSVETVLQNLPSAAAFGALHNDHFRILFEIGLIGAVLWVLAWGMLIWRLRGARLAVCILGSVAVTMVTDNTLSYGHYLLCCGMAAGIAMHEVTHGE
tara:strand:+ start:143366 stop:144451 length:1086 start_codon:yes stop_codon:yes gene_type:complete